MSRAVQPEGTRGSLKWIQRAVEERWPALDGAILQKLAGATEIEWRSPLRADDFAEYRDADFLERLGLGHLAEALAAFWPRRGPQWDALGRSDAGHILLVEAKAHIGEFCTPGTSAGPASRAVIQARLAEVADALGATPGRPWADLFYQLANRLAHLHFLRAQGVPAFLVLVGFLDDRDMDGPSGAETWVAAYQLAAYALGLPTRHALSPFIVHAFPAVPNV